MPLSPETMRLLLVGCMISMTLLAAFYLRHRQLSPFAYAAWGIFALILPLVGPFFVIWFQPGEGRTT